jgi:hypothetical protein
MTRLINRRHVLKAAAAGVFCAAGWPGRRVRAAEATIREVKVISRQPELYHGWPTLARRRSGQLLLVCSGGREAHVCPFGRVELMRSDDDGQTWGPAAVLLDGPIDDRDSGVLETDRGTILVTTFTSLAYESILKRAEQAASAGEPGAWPAEKLARWQAVHNKLTAAERQAELGTWMIRSTDGGATWSPRYDSLVNSPHGPIQLADGRLLYAGKELWRGENRCGVCESTDDGITWRWLATLPTRKGDDHRSYHELHAVHADGGRIVLQLRNHNKANSGETLQSESSDGGRTWSAPHAIGVWGLPSHLMRLADGPLLMTYGHRRPPFGCQARLSDDRGDTWSEPIVVYGKGASGDLGYPSTVQLADGTLLSAWYEKLGNSPRAVLQQARWAINS